jgi:hypothetical protein
MKCVVICWFIEMLNFKDALLFSKIILLEKGDAVSDISKHIS